MTTGTNNEGMDGMTVDERIDEAVGAIARRVSRLELERIIRESIEAAVEAETERLEAENKSLRATLEIFEDGANWEVYLGLRDLPIYEWNHDSDPRVLAQDACNNAGGNDATNAAVLKEREACAKIAAAYFDTQVGETIAEYIRERCNDT